MFYKIRYYKKKSLREGFVNRIWEGHVKQVKATIVIKNKKTRGKFYCKWLQRKTTYLLYTLKTWS